MLINQQQKISIINGIKDENYFRKEVLIPMFRNMKVYAQVIDNHGNTEKGTDIILIEIGRYGEYHYESVIVKSKPINNSTSGKDTAASVSQQITMASKSGFNCPIQKRRVRFDRIMVVTSQTISNDAQETLASAGEHEKISITPLWGDRLAQKIDEYLPDFYFYKSSQFSQLATSMRRKYERLYDLQKIPRYKGEAKALVDIFVEPRLRFTDLGNKNHGRTIKYLTISQILETHNLIAIIGGAGTGKSTLVRELVMKLQASNTRDKEPNIPLLVRALDLVTDVKTTFIEAFNRVIRHECEVADFDISRIQDANLYVIIDGLDEVTDETQKVYLEESLQEFVDSGVRCKILLTSRQTGEMVEPLTHYPDFKRWHLQPFNSAQVRRFIERWFIDHLQSQRLISTLEDHNLLARLPNTPLVLTLLAILFESDNFREIPANLAELYRMFLELLFGKWSLSRRAETMYDANIKEHIATTMALELHCTQQVKMSQQRFENIVAETQETLGIALDAKLLLNDFLNESAILSSENDEIQFSHLSFQEFLVAQFVANQGTQLKQDDLVSTYNDQWWDNVLYFFAGLRQNNSELLPRLVATLPTLETPRQVQAILELGYIIQASYLTPLDIRVNNTLLALKLYFRAIDSIKEISPEEKVTFSEEIIFLALTAAVIEQYGSRFLKSNQFYTKLTDSLNTSDISEAFVMMVVAMISAKLNDTSLIDSTYKTLLSNSYPKLLNTLGYYSRIILEEGKSLPLLQQYNETSKKDLKKIVKKFFNKKQMYRRKVRR